VILIRRGRAESMKHNINSQRMRRIISLSFVALFQFSAAPVCADHDRLRNEVLQFHSFLQNRPKVSSELRNNPQLVNSKRYLDNHDDLEKFLKRHPRVKQEIVTHPSRVFGTYYRENHARWRQH
jgi:hypothetical protein